MPRPCDGLGDSHASSMPQRSLKGDPPPHSRHSPRSGHRSAAPPDLTASHIPCAHKFRTRGRYTNAAIGRDGAPGSSSRAWSASASPSPARLRFCSEDLLVERVLRCVIGQLDLGWRRWLGLLRRDRRRVWYAHEAVRPALGPQAQTGSPAAAGARLSPVRRRRRGGGRRSPRRPAVLCNERGAGQPDLLCQAGDPVRDGGIRAVVVDVGVAAGQDRVAPPFEDLLLAILSPAAALGDHRDG